MTDELKRAIAALKLCVTELRCWQAFHGTDLATQEAIDAATEVINSPTKGGGRILAAGIDGAEILTD